MTVPIDYILGEKEWLEKILTSKQKNRLRISASRRKFLERSIKVLESQKYKARQYELDVMRTALKIFRSECEHDMRSYTGSKLGYGDEREEYEYSKCVKCGDGGR